MGAKQSSDRPTNHDIGRASFELGSYDNQGRLLQAKIDQLFSILNALEAMPYNRIGRRLTRFAFIRRVSTSSRLRRYWRGVRKALRFVKRTPHYLKHLRVSTLRSRYRHGLDWRAAYALDKIALPKTNRPEVSIIIPAYNKINLTVQCIAAIGRIKTKYSYEIVLIDNASADATPLVLQDIENLVYIRNQENAGFVDGCNQGADIARGETIVFLNNDTEVSEDWLDPLIDTLDEPGVGLVGSMLLYPSGVLQEAGGIIFSDASGHNYGKGHDPGGYRYNFKRPVDYCSGASIALRHELFNRVGKFDRRYAPAYYEDTDLAFSVRAAGLQVIYQPNSRVFHIEGATAGTSTSGGGYKRFQAINHEKFFDKWRETLATDHAPAGTHPDRALALRHKKRALVIDHIVPTPDLDSGSVRMNALVGELQGMGYHVVFWPDNLSALEPYTKHMQQRGVEVIFGDENFTEHAYVHHDEYELVILSRPTVAPSYLHVIQDSQPHAKVIYDTVDLAYLRVARQAEINGEPSTAAQAELWRTVELGLINRVDASLVVSDIEQAILKETLPEAKIAIVSNIHRPADLTTPSFKERAGLVFIANYDHEPNVDAMIWFVTHVLPLVREKRAIELTILGSNIRPEITSLGNEDGVEVVGYVPTVDAYFDKARVLVSPLRYGAGVKGKIGQAFEYGLPVVTTPVGAEGMHIRDGHEALIATEAADFAAAVLRLYDNEKLWQQLRQNGAALIEHHFSPRAARRALTGLLERIDAE